MVDSSLGTQLCDACDAIDFAAYFLPPDINDDRSWNNIKEVTYKEIELGKCAEIKQKSVSCAFCHLAYSAAIARRQEMPDDVAMRMSSFCYAKKTDGSFLYQSESGKCDEEPAYCIRILWKVGEAQFAGHIQLLADDAHLLGISKNFLARIPTESGFDMKQACRWLDLCQMNTEGPCNAPAPRPSDLFAIDLVSMSICCLPENSQYVALSYCWPSTPYLTLIRANREELFQHNALLNAMDKLPGTIQDALKCAQQLRFRYLWIDALCIIQDDDNHKIKQLRQMDRVYSCATLTIVCAYPVPRDAPDPCSGLPGFEKSDPKRKRYPHMIKGLRMVVASEGPYLALDRARWSTRAWTFQEEHLSPKLLYFTPAQVYYECACSSFCEDVLADGGAQPAYVAPGSTLWSMKKQYNTGNLKINWGQWHLSRKPLATTPEKWRSYTMALSTYTSRDVTYPTDVLNAFEGVRAVLSEAMQTDFWQGIPENILPLALCWQLNGVFRRRETSDDYVPLTEMLFPSWSWAGWISKVDLNLFMPICACKNDAEWFIINDAGAATRLTIRVDDKEEDRDANDIIDSDIIKKKLPNIVPRSEVTATSAEWRNARTLAVLTTSAIFTLDETKHSVSAIRHERLWPRSQIFAIKDANGITAGCILLPKRFFKQRNACEVKYEFIAISRSLQQRYWEEPKELRYFDDSVYGSPREDRSWVVNVMMIERGPDDLAIRVAVGVVHEDAWRDADTETTFVKLI